MTITVRLFSVLRETAGTDRVTLDVPPGIRTGEVVRRVCAQFPALDPFAPIIRTAVNDDWAPADQVVEDGDELALLSPVSGG